MSAPRGYPATIASLYVGFFVGLILSAVGVAFAGLPVLLAATLTDVLPAAPAWTATAAIAITSGAWTAAQFTTADTDSDTDVVEFAHQLTNHISFVATLLALGIVYMSVLIAAPTLASDALLGAGYPAWATFAAFILPVADMALTRRFGVSPGSLTIVFLSAVIDLLGVFDDTHRASRIPLFGIRLFGYSGSTAP